MSSESLSVLRLRNILLVTVPDDPGDDIIGELQDKVLSAMEKYEARGLILDIARVNILDSFFARTISETAQMVALMGGCTVIAGMQPSVAITATELGLRLGNAISTLNLDQAFDLLDSNRHGAN
jgi:rsbT antagonist protein RsbS